MTETLVVETTGPEDKKYNKDLSDALGGLECSPVYIPYLELPDNIDRIKAAARVIIAGVPYTYPEIAEDLKPYLLPWLPDIEVPVLGICLGHQAIGLTFGAKMRREEEIETGTVTAEINDEHMNDLIFKGMKKRFEVESFHWASIDINAAPEEKRRLIRLASSLKAPEVSTGCENLVVRVADKQIYGAQFHPELSASGLLFLRNFLELPTVR